MHIRALIEFILTSLYGVVYSLAVGFLFYNTLMNSTAETVVSNRFLIIGAIVIIMGCPMWVSHMYRAGYLRRWSRWLMVIAYVFTIVVVGFSAISWYLSPNNGRWEPLTIILGFTASWITLLQSGWQEEDRILSFFDFEDNTEEE